jgi:hypothetical protein
MLDLGWMTQRFVSPPAARRRVLVLVDRASSDVRLLSKVAPNDIVPPAAIVWLWVVTPGAVVSWGALLAESGDRTRIVLSALSERMEEARRFLTPLQHQCKHATIPCQIHVLHGTVVESVVRLARGEEVEQVLLASEGGSLYGQPPQELAASLARRLALPVGILE